ncbi:MAG: phage holin family protein [Muribaculaceae bacterium]|nr:phage holin family protein [Muribaculaceae bacterium]
MKDNLIDHIKEIFRQSQIWLKLEVEYVRLTAAEKFTVLLSTLILGAICLLIFMVAVILLSFALVDVFKIFLTPALAYLSVAGVLIILIGLILIFRKPLLFNPIAKFITKLFCDNSKS